MVIIAMIIVMSRSLLTIHASEVDSDLSLGFMVLVQAVPQSPAVFCWSTATHSATQSSPK